MAKKEKVKVKSEVKTNQSSNETESNLFFLAQLAPYGLSLDPKADAKPIKSESKHEGPDSLGLNSTQVFMLKNPPYVFKSQVKVQSEQWRPLLPKLETSLRDYASQSVPHLVQLLSPLINASSTPAPSSLGSSNRKSTLEEKSNASIASSMGSATARSASSSGPSSSSQFYHESLLQLLLNVEPFQMTITRLLCSWILEYSGLPEFEQHHLLATLLHQLKWLDNIAEPEAFAKPLFDLLEGLNEASLREVVPALPEIVPESQHLTLLDLLTNLFTEHPSLTASIVDAFSNLVLPPSAPSLISLIEMISEALVSAQESDVPLLLRFLFNPYQVTAASAKDVITLVRSHLDISDLSNLTLVLEEYRMVLRRHKTFYNAYKQILFGLSAPSTGTKEKNAWNDLDILVLVIMGSLSPSACKEMERVLKTCLLKHTLTPAHMERALSNYAPCLQEYHSTLLSFAHSLFALLSTQHQVGRKAAFPSIHQFSSNVAATGSASTPSIAAVSPVQEKKHLSEMLQVFLVQPFQHFDMAQKQDWIAALVAFVGSGTPPQVDMALSILSTLVEKCASQILPFTMFVKGLLDYLDNLTLPQIRNFFLLLAQLGFAEVRTPVQLQNNGIIDALSILAKKYLSRYYLKQKAVGILAALVLIKYNASKHISTWDEQDIYACLTNASELLETCDQSCTENSIRSFFYDQLAYFIEPYETWHPDFLVFVFHTYHEKLQFFTTFQAITSSSPSGSSSSTGANGATSQRMPWFVVAPTPMGRSFISSSNPIRDNECSSQVTESLNVDPCAYLSSQRQVLESAHENSENDTIEGIEEEQGAKPLTLFFVHETCSILPSLLRLVFAASQVNPSTYQAMKFIHARLVAHATAKTDLIAYLRQIIHSMALFHSPHPDVLLRILDALAVLDVKTQSVSARPRSKATTFSMSLTSNTANSSFLLNERESVFPAYVFELLPKCHGTKSFTYLVSEYLTYLQSTADSIKFSIPILQCLCETLMLISKEPDSSSEDVSKVPSFLTHNLFQILLLLFQQYLPDKGDQLLSKLAQILSPMLSSSPPISFVSEESLLTVVDFFSAFAPSASSPSIARCIFQSLLVLYHVSNTRHPLGSITSRLHDIAADFLSRTWSTTLKSDILDFFITQELRFTIQPLIRLKEYSDCMKYLFNPDLEPPSTQIMGTCPLLNKATFLTFFKTCFRRLPLLISADALSQVEYVAEDEMLAEPLIEYLQAVTPIFVDLVQMTKLRDVKQVLQIALSEGSKFVGNYNTIVFPAISNRFVRAPKVFLEWIKKMQPATRQLQAICGFSKVSADPVLMMQVPKTRKVLEEFIQAAKLLLIQHKCSDAWWTGSLKHRDMQGQVVSSQLPQPQQEIEDEDEEEVEVDEAQLEKDLQMRQESDQEEDEELESEEEETHELVPSPPRSKIIPAKRKRLIQKRRVPSSDEEEEENEEGDPECYDEIEEVESDEESGE